MSSGGRRIEIAMTGGRRLIFDHDGAKWRCVLYAADEAVKAGETRATGKDPSLTWAIARALGKTAPDNEARAIVTYAAEVYPQIAGWGTL